MCRPTRNHGRLRQVSSRIGFQLPNTANSRVIALLAQDKPSRTLCFPHVSPLRGCEKCHSSPHEAGRNPDYERDLRPE